ncbi:RNA recognition motif domain-containing protein [Mucilaginibacter lacusdianchii]|uniref:RNA recognition motif domain-containing protein n=1 Tax=Mucilaginibacter lacusdianchii TaxID=2684211 RepID=UPI00131CFD42|nr:RNA-binding protein [Mucilaginibacter sp. JXJ CY 39]
MKIFVARLPYEYQETDIAALFAPYGEVATVNLVMDRETGRSKCYAFVEMPNEGEASNAISRLDQTEINRKQIVVSPAQERAKTNNYSSGNGFSRNAQRSNGGGGAGTSGGYDNNRSGGNSYNRDRNSYNGRYNRNKESNSDY